MAYMVKNPGLLPNMQSVKAGDIGKRRKEMAQMIEGTWRSCIEAGDGMGEKIPALNVDEAEDLFIADAIIANPPAFGHIHCAEKLGVPLHMMFTYVTNDPGACCTNYHQVCPGLPHNSSHILWQT